MTHRPSFASSVSRDEMRYTLLSHEGKSVLGKGALVHPRLNTHTETKHNNIIVQSLQRDRQPRHVD